MLSSDAKNFKCSLALNASKKSNRTHSIKSDLPLSGSNNHADMINEIVHKSVSMKSNSSNRPIRKKQQSDGYFRSKSTQKTNLLNSAAEGLSDLTHSSSDEDTLSVRSHQLFGSGKAAVHRNNFRLVNMDNVDNDGVLLAPTYHKSTKGSYDQLTDPRMIGLHKFRTINATLSRPRLPHPMESDQLSSNGSHQNKASIINDAPVEKSSTENLDSYLINTQKIVSQLERRLLKKHQTVENNSTDVTKHNVLDRNEFLEDYEVAKLLDNADQLLASGTNKRLITLLKRRQANQHKGHGNEMTKVNTYSNICLMTNTGTHKCNRSKPGSRPRSQQTIDRIHLLTSPSTHDYSVTTNEGSNKLNVNRPVRNTTTNRDQSNSNRSDNSSVNASSKSTIQMQGECKKSNKLTSNNSWQRRKAYDPKQCSNKTSGTTRSQSRSRKSTTALSNANACNVKCAFRPSYGVHRAGYRRSAPVETADCVEAMNVLLQTKLNMSQMKQYMSGIDSNSNGFNLVDNVFNECDKIHDRSLNINPKPMKPEAKSTVRNGTIQNDKSKSNSICVSYPRANEPGKRTTAVNKVSPPNLNCPLPSEQNHANGEKCCNNCYNYLPHPDQSIETIKRKIEILTNFIVLLRKRIDQDFAEQGTCSPGDDVFGEEAVGAIIDGCSTGMHPAVASSLQNLRILEVNAQEIFNLLYPNEIDLWSPTRTCMTESTIDQDTRSQMSNRLTDSTEQINGIGDII